MGDDLVPSHTQDVLAVRLEQRLAFGVLLACDFVIVPGGAVGLDHDALVRPTEVRDHTAAFEVQRSVHIRLREAAAKKEIQHQVLEFGTGGRWASGHDPSELANTPACPSKSVNDLHQLAETH